MTAALENPGFETEGPATGTADRWVEVAVVRKGSMISAGFAQSAEQAPLVDPNDITSGNWSIVGTGRFADSATAPDGTATADLLTFGTLAIPHYIYNNQLRTLAAGKRYAFGCYLRNTNNLGAQQIVGISADVGGGNLVYLVIDTLNEDPLFLLSEPVGNVAKVGGRVELFDDGTSGPPWRRVSLMLEIGASAVTLYPRIQAFSGTGSPNVDCGNFGVYVWGGFFFAGELSDVEGFEAAWNNDTFFVVLGSTQLASYTAVAPPSETFEGFEVLWTGNENYMLVFTGFGADETPATYTGAGAQFDKFETEWGNGDQVSRTCTVDPTSDVFTSATRHGFLDGHILHLTTSGTLPGGLAVDTPYYVVNSDPSGFTFQLALTLGGEPIDVTDAGTGTHTLVTEMPTALAASSIIGNDFIIFSHPFLGGEKVRVSSTGTLPAPLHPQTGYYILVDDADSISFSSDGLTPITLTDAGTGTHYVTFQRALYSSTDNDEDYEDGWSNGVVVQRTVSATPATDVLNLANHPFVGGEVFTLTTASGSTLPAPLQPDTDYWVVSVPSSSTFKISDSPGGAPIDITSAGPSSFTLNRDVPTSPTFTANTTTEEWQQAAHSMVVGMRYQVDSTSILPSPIVALTSYYVISTTTNAWIASTSRGGAALNLTTTGSGSHFVVRVFANYAEATSGIASATDAENFETTRRTRQYTADPTTDTFTSAAHGYSTNDVIFFTNSGGQLPLGIAKTQPYYVIGATTNTFQVSLTQGGAAVNITDAGIGLQYFYGDPARYWIDFNDTI